ALVVFLLFAGLVLPGQAASAETYSGNAGSPDLSFYYSAQDLYHMTEVYGDQGRGAYVRARFTFDLIWPLVYTFFLCTAISWVYTRAFTADSLWRGANLVPVLAMLFDYLENLSVSLVMLRYPHPTNVVDSLAPLFTMLKWVLVIGSVGLLFAGAAIAVWQWIKKRSKPSFLALLVLTFSILSLTACSLFAVPPSPTPSFTTPTETPTTTVPATTATKTVFPIAPIEKATEGSATLAPEPCSIVAQGDVTVYSRPSSNAAVFGSMASGFHVIPQGRTADGWLGFDPGVAQAANVGIFRLRWIEESSNIELEGTCEDLPELKGPPVGVCFTMPMDGGHVYTEADVSSEIIATMRWGDYAAVTGKTKEDWARVDLSVGNVGLDLAGWVQGVTLNLNGPCDDLPTVKP
ncbi:MAG: SH3 domain-containing protein, partial [Anaerolineales bacterium]